MAPQIEIDHVDKIYDSNGLSVSALTDISLTLAIGDFAVLAGPSGSGKSTLLHIIGALDTPTRGSVRVGGQELVGQSPHFLSHFRLTQIGFVFQAYNLIPVLTAQENVEYPLLLQGVTQPQREAHAKELLESVGLSDLRFKRPNEMSGGQQQRVAVARALAGSPQIVLADEPTANLDSVTGAALIDLFRNLNDRFHTTFLFASHDPMVIERARRVIRLKDGRIVL
jgi:putative ABC transport system ATP-binding protein